MRSNCIQKYKNEVPLGNNTKCNTMQKTKILTSSNGSNSATAQEVMLLRSQHIQFLPQTNTPTLAHQSQMICNKVKICA